MLGQGSEELELLRAFEFGADDYLASPLRYLELRARMRALLRRVSPRVGSDDGRLLRTGPLSIDRAKRSVRLHGEPIQLRRLEYELLAQLAEDPERVCARHDLLRLVWETDRLPVHGHSTATPLASGASSLTLAGRVSWSTCGVSATD